MIATGPKERLHDVLEDRVQSVMGLRYREVSVRESLVRRVDERERESSFGLKRIREYARQGGNSTE